MKRLLVLLIFVAGGLAAAAFVVPSNAATVNGVAISQQQLSSDLTAIADSTDYQCFLNAEQAVGSGGQTGLPPVVGAGQVVGSGSHPTVTTSFAASYLDTAIGHQLVLQLAAARRAQVTTQDLATARTELADQITATLQEVSGSKYQCPVAGLTGRAVLDTLPASFIDENVRFDATVNVLAEDLAGVGSSRADLQRYFAAHSAEFDTACFTVAQYSSQAAAQAAAAQVNAGTPFAQVATQAGGGPQGCDILYQVAADLPAGTNLGSLAVGTVSQPITEGSAFLLVEITRRTPTSFAKAMTEVESAVQSAGTSKTRAVIDAAEKHASVSVDQRYGEWVPGRAEVLAPSSPLATDVLNPLVNG